MSVLTDSSCQRADNACTGHACWICQPNTCDMHGTAAVIPCVTGRAYHCDDECRNNCPDDDDAQRADAIDERAQAQREGRRL